MKTRFLKIRCFVVGHCMECMTLNLTAESRAAEFAGKRAEILSEPDIPNTVNELEDIVYGEPEVSDAMLALEGKIFGNSKMDAARRALIAKKRAAELARLLQARLGLRQKRDRLLSPAQAPAAYALETVTTAVNTAWASAKNARAGTSMLELTVCGAVQTDRGNNTPGIRKLEQPLRQRKFTLQNFP